MFLQRQEEDYFEQFAERVAADRKEPFDSELDAAETMDDWLRTKALKNRGLYAPSLNRSEYIRISGSSL